MNILIYYTENDAASPLLKVLSYSNFNYQLTTNKEECISYLQNKAYQALIVLHPRSIDDLLIDYRQFQKAISTLPVIVITRQQSALQRVNALNAGIRQYVIEPFSYTQLVQDITAIGYGTQKEEILTFGMLQIFPERFLVLYENHPYNLSKSQFLLLLLLCRSPFRIYTRVQIWEHLWGLREYPLTNSIDVAVRRLRRVLPTAVAKAIQTVHGLGYRFSPKDESLKCRS